MFSQACVIPPGTIPHSWPYPPPPEPYPHWDHSLGVDKRAVRFLLECFIVLHFHSVLGKLAKIMSWRLQLWDWRPSGKSCIRHCHWYGWRLQDGSFTVACVLTYLYVTLWRIFGAPCSVSVYVIFYHLITWRQNLRRHLRNCSPAPTCSFRSFCPLEE